MPMPPTTALLLQIADGASYVIAQVPHKAHAAGSPDVRLDSGGVQAYWQTRRWRADSVIVEESSVGRALVTDLPDEISRRVDRYKPQLSKEARLMIQSGKIADKLVWVPQEAPASTPSGTSYWPFPMASTTTR